MLKLIWRIVRIATFILQEWGNIGIKGVLGNICGFMTVVGGIFLLNAFREMSISWRDVTSAAKANAAMNNNKRDNLIESHQLIEVAPEQNETESPPNGLSGSDNAALSRSIPV